MSFQFRKIQNHLSIKLKRNIKISLLFFFFIYVYCCFCCCCSCCIPIQCVYVGQMELHLYVYVYLWRKSMSTIFFSLHQSWESGRRQQENELSCVIFYTKKEEKIYFYLFILGKYTSITFTLFFTYSLHFKMGS